MSTAVQIRFDVVHSPSLPDGVRARLLGMLRSRLTKEGILILTAQKYRSQDRNRQDARQRLATLIYRATIPPTKRIPSKPTRASKESRLASKARRGQIKRGRRMVGDSED